MLPVFDRPVIALVSASANDYLFKQADVRGRVNGKR